MEELGTNSLHGTGSHIFNNRSKELLTIYHITVNFFMKAKLCAWLWMVSVGNTAVQLDVWVLVWSLTAIFCSIQENLSPLIFRGEIRVKFPSIKLTTFSAGDFGKGSLEISNRGGSSALGRLFSWSVGAHGRAWPWRVAARPTERPGPPGPSGLSAEPTAGGTKFKICVQIPSTWKLQWIHYSY